MAVKPSAKIAAKLARERDRNVEKDVRRHDDDPVREVPKSNSTVRVFISLHEQSKRPLTRGIPLHRANHLVNEFKKFLVDGITLSVENT